MFWLFLRFPPNGEEFEDPKFLEPLALGFLSLTSLEVVDLSCSETVDVDVPVVSRWSLPVILGVANPNGLSLPSEGVIEGSSVWVIVRGANTRGFLVLVSSDPL